MQGAAQAEQDQPAGFVLMIADAGNDLGQAEGQQPPV